LDIKKVDKALNQLYSYGETVFIPELAWLKENSLIEVIDYTSVITANWVEYGKQFQSQQDHIRSLFCFDKEYQQYLLQVALLTVLKMREAEDTEGLMEFVSKMPKLSEFAVVILKEIASDELKNFDTTVLEKRINNLEASFQDLNHYLFDGVPQYQRIVSYLEKVQLYQAKDIESTETLGSTIDQQWQRGRKIAADLKLTPLKEQPITVLAPFDPHRSMTNPFFHHLLTYPWKLFVFQWCVVREHYEAQGAQAVRFQLVDGQVDVLIMSRKNQEFRYGTFNDFAFEFCKINQYQTFPDVQPNLASIFYEFFDRKVLRIVDEEFRLGTHIEDGLYNTSAFIPLIAKSKLLRQRMQQWVDELRNKS